MFQVQGALIEVVRDADALERYVADWDALAADAVEPNPFFESGALLAALRHLKLPGSICCVLVYRAAGAGSARRLIAFAPFMRTRKGPRGIFPCYRTLTHVHCFLHTPLVHRDHVDGAIDALIGWINDVPDGVRIFGFYGVAGDGPITQSLQRRLDAARLANFTESSYERAFLRVDGGVDQYISRAIPAKKRKELRRQHNRLGELGPVDVTQLPAYADASSWIDRFLTLEAMGWKGERGNAFNRTPEERAFFRAFVEYFRARGRAMLLALRLDGQEIAMKCNLVAASSGGSFAFKIAHDSNFARYSPGVLLELENMRLLYEPARRIAWMDSCASPHHPMIDHLWRERRRIVYLTCCGRGPIGRSLVAALKWRKRHLERAKG